MAETQFLDLDAVDLPVQLVVKLGGKEHPLVPVTVESFVANTKLLQQLSKAKDGDLEAEVNLVIKVILRAFPTMTDEMLRKMPLANLNKLMGVAQDNDGTKAVEKAVEQDVKANPPVAAE